MATPSLQSLTERLRAHLAEQRPEADLLAAGSEWNLSQTVQHCAQTVGYSVTGYPRLKPWPYRTTVGALAKRVFLARGATRHPLGAEIDGAPPLRADLPVGEALALLTDAVARFTGHRGPHPPHPAYGSCTHEEFDALHAMHLAEHVPGAARE